MIANEIAIHQGQLLNVLIGKAAKSSVLTLESAPRKLPIGVLMPSMMYVDFVICYISQLLDLR